MKYQCKECEYGASQSTNLKHHIASIPKKNFQCDACGSAASLNHNLQLYVNGKHDAWWIFNVMRAIIQRRKKKTKKKHLIAVNMKDRSFKCDDCEYCLDSMLITSLIGISTSQISSENEISLPRFLHSCTKPFIASFSVFSSINTSSFS